MHRLYIFRWGFTLTVAGVLLGRAAAAQGSGMSPQRTPAPSGPLQGSGVPSAAEERADGDALGAEEAEDEARAEDEERAEKVNQTTESPAWMPAFELHGGVAAYLYQPTNGPSGQLFIYSNAKVQAAWDWFGIFLEARLSSEKMRPYYDSLTWMQQGYVFFKLDPVMLKIGKTYKQVGLAWDHTFYGNIQVYDGLKFDPNLGVSLEGSWGERLAMSVVAQYFYVDGHLNASLAGRDTVSIPGARRRNTVVLRLEPSLAIAEGAKLTLGLSGEVFQADLPDVTNSVGRAAADVMLTVAHWGLWGEVLHQWGANVTEFPYSGDPETAPPTPGRSSASNTYLLFGTELALGPVVPRYTLSIATYEDVEVREVLHLPGVSWNVHPNASIWVEYAFWDRASREGALVYDRSLNLTVMGFF